MAPTGARKLAKQLGGACLGLALVGLAACGGGDEDIALSQTTQPDSDGGGAETPPLPVGGDGGVPENRTYKLDTGDRLDINVFGEEDLSGEVTVSEDGTIAIPLVGSVEAKGKSVGDLEETLVTRLEDGYLQYPQVSIEVLNYRPFYILGEVENPGSYSYVQGMTVLNAVALAGGFTPRARQDQFYLERPGTSAQGAQPVDASTRVLPGDIVHVRQRRLF